MSKSRSLHLTPARFCELHNACYDGAEFANKFETMAQVWDNCHRVDWLIWIMKRLGQEPDRKALRLFACWCVRETPISNSRKVWDLLTDERSRNAVVVAERFANGNATDAELAAARDAARAAAGDAARAAAWDAAWDAAGAAAWAAAGDAARAAAWDAAWDAAGDAAWDAAGDAAWDAAGAFQADHFRTIFKNPFNS